MDFVKTLKDAYRAHQVKSAGFDPSDPKHVENMQKELQTLEKSNDPKGKAYGMEGKTVGQILDESNRIKTLRNLLKSQEPEQ